MSHKHRISGMIERGVVSAAVAVFLSVVLPAHTANFNPPDWSGTWRAVGSVGTLGSEKGIIFAKETRDYAPLKPQYEAEYDALRVRAEEQGDPNAKDPITDTNTLNCFAGMPRLIAAPFSYNFLITPTEVFIIIDKAVRQVFTDGRPWPSTDAQWPLMLGRSRGTWQGDTLVIDTINMRNDMWTDPTPLMLSSQASVEERLRKINPTTIEDQVTIHDPVKFTKDWKFVRHYAREPDDKTSWPDDPELCGGPSDRNRIVNGQVTVTLPQ